MSSEDAVNVLIGGYLSKQAADEDYESVLGAGVHLHGAVVVSKNLEGELTVEESDHMVRDGAAGLGAVGFAVGLFAPPLLAATAVGAALGASAGELLHHGAAGKIGEQAGETIPIGGAGLIVAYAEADASAVEAAVTRAVTTSTGRADGHHVKALKAALEDAQAKMKADEGS